MAFNQLTDSQAERLALLLEELGEAQQAIGKVLRHGYSSFHPFKPELGSNREQLAREIGDVQAAIELLFKALDILPPTVDMYRHIKLQNVKQYLHHQ